MFEVLLLTAVPLYDSGLFISVMHRDVPHAPTRLTVLRLQLFQLALLNFKFLLNLTIRKQDKQ